MNDKQLADGINMNDEMANIDSYIKRMEKPCGVPPAIQREAAQIMRKQSAKLADYADLTLRLQEQCDRYMSNAMDAWDRISVLERSWTLWREMEIKEGMGLDFKYATIDEAILAAEDGK